MGHRVPRPGLVRFRRDAALRRDRRRGLHLCLESRRAGMGVEKTVPPALVESLELLRETFAGDLLEASMPQGDATAIIRPPSLLKVMDFLKNDPRLLFTILADITAVDYLGRKPRFDVVYHLLAMQSKQRLRIKLRVEEGEAQVDSITSLWGSANWLEREVWDMFGI